MMKPFAHIPRLCPWGLTTETTAALADRAQAYLSKTAYSQALDDWNKQYKDCPEGREDTLVDRGSTYSLMGKDELALADWQAALELDPNDPVIFKNRALLLMSVRKRMIQL